MTEPKRKSGLISEHSKWIGRWGVYWRIQKWKSNPLVYGLAMKYAEAYPRTWELRLIIYKSRVTVRRHRDFQAELGISENDQQTSMDNEQCSKTSPPSTGSSSQFF